MRVNRRIVLQPGVQDATVIQHPDGVAKAGLIDVALSPDGDVRAKSVSAWEARAEAHLQPGVAGLVNNVLSEIFKNKSGQA